MEEKLSIGCWFIIFLIIGAGGLVLLIIKVRGELEEVAYLIKDKKIRNAVNRYCAYDLVLTIYLIVLCLILGWFVFAPH